MSTSTKRKCRCPAGQPHKHGKKPINSFGLVGSEHAPPVPPQAATKLLTRIALVVDASGSMDCHLLKTVEMVNRVVDRLKAEKSLESTFSFVRFGTSVEIVTRNAGLAGIPKYSLNDISVFRLKDSTALYDATIEAAQVIQPTVEPDTAYVVIVLTDGQNNSGRMTSQKLIKGIAARQATDRWTFAFMLPKGYKDSFVRMSGVPPGNCQEWDDMEIAAKQIDVAMANFFEQRTTERATSSKAFFQTDLSKISTHDLERLPDVTSQYRFLTVDKEEVIKPFIEAAGIAFTPGIAFYCLTKKEDVQHYKELLLVKKGTKIVRANARGLLGMPAAGIVRVEPGNHSEYDLYVQSTSLNRKLVRGTKLLVKVR